MSYRSLAHFISVLESAGELSRIKEFVSPTLEITEVADRMVKNGGKALLFENNGTGFPLLINAFASDRRICLALGVNDLEDIDKALAGILQEFTRPKHNLLDKLKMLPALQQVASWMPRLSNKKGICQEVVMEKPDLTKLPVLTCWPADGGPFITLPGVHTKDPVTGIRNLGMYRMQVFSPDTTGMHWHLHKGSASHYNHYKKLGKKMPVTVTLGGDPVYTYAATAPIPENLDEYLLAGFLRRKKVELVRCLSNDLEVPSDVDFVVEGYVDPSEELIREGPFGDHTGFYSLAGFFPRFHVTCITHRKNAIYPATIVGIPPQEDGWIGKATERIFLMPLKMTIAPEIVDMHMPVEGVFHNLAFVSISKQYPGQAIKVMNSLWGAGQMMFNKIMVITDAGTNLRDYPTMSRIISDSVDPLNDVHFIRGTMDILDHSSSGYAYGSKIGIDATRKFAQELSAPPSVTNLDEKGEGEHPGKPMIQAGLIRQAFPETGTINTDLLSAGISCVIIPIKKSKKHHVRQVATELLLKEWVSRVKFLIFVDDLVDSNVFSGIVWIVSNNIDPIRDCFHIDQSPGMKFHELCIDGTRKTRNFDDFDRDWPNVIVMNDQTIRSVDAKWQSLGLGPLIPSPSNLYKSLVTNSGAMVKDDF